MNEQEPFNHAVVLPGRRAGHALVLTYEAAKRLGWNFVTIKSGELICLLRDPAGHEILIRFTFVAEKVNMACTGAGDEQARQLAAAFEKTVSKLSGLADTETLDEEYRALHQAYFAGEQLVQQPQPGLAGIIRPVSGYRITPVLLLINVLIYLVMVGSGVNWLMPDPELMIQWGANYKPLTLNGGWWRLLTAGFLHFGIIHLAMNMFALVQIGQTIERFIGSWRFLVAYLIALISGNILSLAWNDISISAGASGAVFGMFGVFLALLTTKLIARSVRRSLLMSIISVIGFNLVFGMQAGIDNAGHIGGLIGGLLAGYAMVPALRKHDKSLRGYGLIALLGIAVISLAIIVLKKLPNDYPAFDKRMEQITQLEEKALAVFNNIGAESDLSLPGKINSEGIPAWKRIIRLTDEIDSLNLPDAYKERNKHLRKYAELRLKSYELRYNAATADSQTYDEEIKQTELEIEKLLKELNKK